MQTIIITHKPINDAGLSEELTAALGNRFQGLTLDGQKIEVRVLDHYEMTPPPAQSKDANKSEDENAAIDAANTIQWNAANAERKLSEAAARNTAVHDVLAKHDFTRLTASQIAIRQKATTRDIVIERQGVNVEALHDELKAALGEHVTGATHDQRGVILHLDKSAPPEAENTARQIVLKHDMTKKSAAQQAHTEREAAVQTARATLATIDPAKLSGDDLLRTVLTQMQAIHLRLDKIEGKAA